MKPEVKKLWIDALLSGDFEQGTGSLNDGRKYCCLGVLCEVAIREGVPVSKNAGSYYADTCYDGVRAYLPVVVREWAELTEDDPVILKTPDTSGLCHLSTLNDSGRYDFKAIAGLIEAQL